MWVWVGVSTSVIHLISLNVHSFQEFVDLFGSKLLSKRSEDCASSVSFCQAACNCIPPTNHPLHPDSGSCIQFHSPYFSSPTPINPVISLSKTWKPLTNSSGSPGSRNPFGRLSILRKFSKSTKTNVTLMPN